MIDKSEQLRALKTSWTLPTDMNRCAVEMAEWAFHINHEFFFSLIYKTNPAL